MSINYKRSRSPSRVELRQLPCTNIAEYINFKGMEFHAGRGGRCGSSLPPASLQFNVTHFVQYITTAYFFISSFLRLLLRSCCFSLGIFKVYTQGLIQEFTQAKKSAAMKNICKPAGRSLFVAK